MPNRVGWSCISWLRRRSRKPAQPPRFGYRPSPVLVAEGRSTRLSVRDKLGRIARLSRIISVSKRRTVGFYYQLRHGHCPYGQKTRIRCFSRITLNTLGTLNLSVLLIQPIEPQSFNNFKYLTFDILGILLRNSQTSAVSPAIRGIKEKETFYFFNVS